ncbi:MAG: hypothetical protein ACE5Z5_00810 [Candidatus Bathyarchaeia archaeon]
MKKHKLTDLFPGVTTKVLEHLIEHPSERFWYHKLASQLGVSTTSVINIVTELNEKGVVDIEELGPGRPSLIRLKEEAPVVQVLIRFVAELKNLE